MSLVLNDVWNLLIPFPFGVNTLLFGLFAIWVVHVCQRLVEQTSAVSDPLGRCVNASHAALCIGCLVWVLDVLGFFLYPQIAMAHLSFAPALASLLVMAISARLAVPALSRSTLGREVRLASVALACGMLLAHFILAAGLAQGHERVMVPGIILSIVLAGGIAAVMAQQHRKARLNGVAFGRNSLNWRIKILAGASVVVLHWFLTNSLSILPFHGGVSERRNPFLLLTVLTFGVAVAADQLNNQRAEKSRQRLLHRALALIRKSPSKSANPRHDHDVSLIADRLPHLLETGQLNVYFQPIVKADSGGLHQEALLRIKDEYLGFIHPEIFLLACELKGVAARVDRLILPLALDPIPGWMQQGMRNIVVSVNVSPDTLLEPGFADWLEQLLEQRDLMPESLQLEMTEHAIIANGGELLSVINDLRLRGIGVWMDDFGVGYSSLGVLAEFPIAGIKCDRQFLKGVRRDPRRQVMLKNIVRLASDLGIEVTAEGVESRDELDAVLASGIGSIQGYLYSPAIPADSIPEWYRLFAESGKAAFAMPMAAPV